MSRDSHPGIPEHFFGVSKKPSCGCVVLSLNHNRVMMPEVYVVKSWNKEAFSLSDILTRLQGNDRKWLLLTKL